MGDSITFIEGPFGCQVPCFPAHYSWVYLICYAHQPYRHAKHYLGSTANLDARLERHKSGNGARLMHVISEAGIEWELARLWRCDTYEEAHALEKKLKKQHRSLLCPICNPRRGVDLLVQLRQGHWPLTLHSASGHRVPSGEPVPHFVRWEVPTTLWHLL